MCYGDKRLKVKGKSLFKNELKVPKKAHNKEKRRLGWKRCGFNNQKCFT